jgi:hypothetical protein
MRGKGLKALQTLCCRWLRRQKSPLPCRLSRDQRDPGMCLGARGRMQAVVHGEYVSPRYLVHAGTAEPLRVSPPEAVAYLLELLQCNGA